MMALLCLLLLSLLHRGLASTSSTRQLAHVTHTDFPLTFNPDFSPSLEQLQLQFDLRFDLPNLLAKRGLLDLDITLGLGRTKLSLSTSDLLNLDLSTLITYDPDWNVAVSKVTNEGNDNAWYSPVHIGTPGQKINLLFDSGSADLLVYDPTCSTCHLGNHTAFNRFLSATYNSTGSTKFQAAYGNSGKQVKGYSGADAVRIGSTRIRKQKLAIVTQANNLNSRSVASGLVGIGPDLLSAIPGTQTVFTNMIKQSLIAKPSVGIALVKGTSARAGGGEYRFGAINENYVAGKIGYASVTTSFYWGTDLTGVYIGDKQTMHPNDSSRVILDTATTLIYISSASAALFYKSIPAARYLSSTDTWTVPCDISKKTLPALPPISFAVQGQRWRMPLEDLAFQGISSNGRCVAAVQGGATSFAVLGDAFIKSHYLVLDYGNSAQTARRIGIADRPDVVY